MSWTAPRTWVTNEVPSAATFNTHIKDNFNHLHDVFTGAQDVGANWLISTGREFRMSTTGGFSHGMTTVSPTDVYGHLAIISSTDGGLRVRGLSDAAAAYGLLLQGIVGNATPAFPGIGINAAKKNGTGVQDFAGTEGAIQFVNNSVQLGMWFGQGLNVTTGGLLVGYAGAPAAGAPTLSVGDSNYRMYFAGTTDVRLEFDAAAGDYFTYDRTSNILTLIIASAAVASFRSGQVQLINGSATAPALTFATTPDTGIFQSGASQLGLVAAGVQLLKLRSDGDIQWMVAQTALGGGAAPTLGTIGGAGPGTAAQNSWLRIRDFAGNVMFIPCWR